jgi:DNA repair protein RadC
MRISLLESCPRIKEPGDLVDSLPEELLKEKREFFGVVYLDTKNKPVAHEVVSVGTLNASIVHPREVFRRAIVESAAAVILVHNHPSGDLEPSPDDREITRQLVEAGKILGIEVLDHIIVNGRREFFSFAGEGLLKERGWY